MSRMSTTSTLTTRGVGTVNGPMGLHVYTFTVRHTIVIPVSPFPDSSSHATCLNIIYYISKCPLLEILLFKGISATRFPDRDIGVVFGN